MNRFTAKYAPYVYATVRVVAGLMFAMHGCQKLFGYPPLPPMPGPPPPYALMLSAGLIEFICGLMIAAGLFGGIAAFLASGQMAVAYFMAHFPHSEITFEKMLPIVNDGELAVLYCFIFLYFAAHGSGVCSLDAALGIAKTTPPVDG